MIATAINILNWSFNLLALDSAQSDLFDVKAKFDEVTAARCVL